MANWQPAGAAADGCTLAGDAAEHGSGAVAGIAWHLLAAEQLTG